MKEHPIIFSAPMVRAILEGHKTMTRRVTKVQCSMWTAEQGKEFFTACRCPYGQPGDRLWVRESAYIAEPGFGPPYDGGIRDDKGRLRTVGYAATMCADSVRCARDFGVKLKPSIFMPRWASRILLEVTAVRVERVCDISEDDAKAEGAEAKRWQDLKQCPMSLLGGIGAVLPAGPRYRYGFYELWDSINAKRGYGWDANPWVWIIEIKRIN